MPTKPAGIREVVALSLNCRWPGFRSTQLEALPWSTRCNAIARSIRALKQRPQLVMAQELGSVARGNQAGDLLTHCLGLRRQALGLNAVGWDDDRFEYVSTQELVFPDGGQWPGRTLVAVKLRERKTGRRIRIGSTHLAVKTSNPPVSSTTARDLRARQIQKVVSAVNDDVDDWPMLLGFDSNYNALDQFPKSPRAIARKYGWR